MFDLPTVRIDSTIFFRAGSKVAGNNCWILNYGTFDAISIAEDSEDIQDEISELNITYKDYLSPLNPYVPEYTLNKNTNPRTSMSFNHLSTFLGAGLRHSVKGKTFKNLKHCRVQFHYYGFRPCGWSYIHEDCAAASCYIGFENNNDLIDNINYPMNSCVLNKCTYVGCESFGIKLNWANQVDLISVNVEKNRGVANVEFFNCTAITGSIYTEYARSFNSIGSKGLILNVYALGLKANYVNFFKTFKSIDQFTATAAGTTIEVKGFDSVTKFGIDGFSSIPITNMIVLKNNKFVSRDNWIKSGSTITLTDAYVTGDVFHICVNAYIDWTPTSRRVDPFLMTGGDFFARFSGSLNNQITGYVSGFLDGSFVVNDAGMSNGTANIWMNPTIDNTPISENVERVMYDARDGVKYNQRFFNGVTFKRSDDNNVNTVVNATIHYPQTGVGSTTIANAHKFVFILTSGYGSAVFTIDEDGKINTTSPNQKKMTIQTTDAAVNGKINIYSDTANTLKWNNLTGGASQFQLLRITS